MSHSVVKDFPTQTDNTLILVVNKNGELSVDKETLDGYAKLGNSQVSILRVDNDEGSTVDMTLDTFHPTDTMEELTISVEDEIIRNYNSFRMDHCYTPLTSPSQQKPPIPPIDDDLELDDLAHTLSILDGSEPIPAKIKPKINEHLPKDPHPKVEIQNSDNNKVTLLNKVNKLGVNNKVYKSVKTVLKGAKVIKKPPEIHPPLDSDSEDDDDDDDLNDSDFELDDSPVKKHSRRPVVNKRRSKLDHDLHNDVRNKVIKVRKGVRQIVYKASGTPQKLNQAINVADAKVEAVIPPQTPQTPQTHQTHQTPQTLQTLQPSDTIKSPEAKKQPKKEKKIPKQIDDGIALFSTPDIIRRVGKSGEKLLSDGSESPTKVKPAKIEDRSKSESGRHSTETKIKHAHRHSLDSKPSAGGQHVVVDKPKVDPVKHHERERRMSNVSDKSSDLNSFNNSGSTHDDVITNHSESFDSISEAVGNLENIIGAGATPTTDMIRSIIHTNEPSIIETTSTPSAAPIASATASNIIATPVDIVQPVVDSPVVDQAQLNLDSTALDIDQNILDNINADELIPEDILYQVAKLVENPDVQNVIDRTLVNLEPTIQAPLTSEQQQQQQSMAVAHAPIQSPSSVSQHVQVPLAANSNSQPGTPKNSPKPIQIIRSDGRVVTLPPIEKPATRSSKKKQETQVVQSPVVQHQQPPPPVQLPPPPPLQPVQAQPVVLLPQLVQPAPKIQPVPPKVQKPLALPLADEFIVDDAAAGDGDTDSDESWNSEDDPDRLWCICKQPHNNRFMICCDTCEDWFHGKCVNVTKAMGQQMEQQGKEWQCPNCVKKVNASVSSSTSSNPNPNVSHPRPARIPPDSIAKRKSTEAGPSCIVCSSAARANSVYCSDACILKHAQGVEKETNKAQKSAPQRIIVFERSTGKCLSGPNAPTANNLKQWLREHPGFEVVRPVNKTKQQNQNLVQSKLQLVKNPHGKEGVGLAVQRKGVQVGVLPHAAKQPNTIKLIPPTKMVPGAKTPTPKQPTQQTSPNKKLVQTTLKSPPTPSASTPTTVTPDKPKPVTPTSKSKVRERKQKLQTPETPRQNAQENIRETVKKTLLEQLLARLKEVEDIKLGEDEVDKMATEIETQLYKLFGDSGPKYRAKYRSLIFNIKDPKNQTLWRRICEKSISPHQLVRLSPEEMASQELARWREQENKHQLDMIKKSELEMLTINRKYVLKTHKGEQVMEDRPSVKVDSTEIMPGLGADSTSEHDTTLDKEKSDHNSDHSTEKRSSSKHSRRDRDRDKRSNKEKARDRSKDHNTSKSSSSRSKRSRSRDRDKDRDRSSHKSDRKRSRSRDRHHRSSHKSSRHKREKHSTEHLDKKSREILDNLENNKIVPPPEDRLWKHVPQQDIQEITPDSDSDHEPTSTVTIPTPPRSTDQEDTTQHALKKEEPVINTAVVAPLPTLVKPELKVETVLPPRSDPRVNREAATSVETPPESECSQPQTTPTLSSNNSNNSPSPALTNTAIWEGHINMADVAKFFISLHEVSGDCVGLDSELTSTLDIVGRITPDTVWDYIGKMKRSNSKLISVLRLTAGNVEEQMQYIALFTYLSNRKRFGVIKTPNSAIKDFYIMPLASHTPIPQALLPLSGPGFKENRPDLLLGIVVRAKRKRPNPIDLISSGPSVKRSRLEDSPNISQTSVSSTPVQQPPRSYTPPPTRDPRIRLPTIPAVAATLPNDDDEPYSPEDSDPESIPVILQKTTKPSIGSISSVAAAAAISIKTGDIASVLSATTKSTSFLETSSAVSSFEPFSNKFDGIPGLDEAPPTNAALIQKQLEELNKCIEQQKDEINSISQNLASTASTSVTSNLSNINLPSNLQQILDSIKNIPSTNVAAQDTEEYCPTAPGYKTAPGDTDDLTIPLMLPKLSSRTQSSRPPPAPSSSSSSSIPESSSSSSSTIPLKLPLPSRGDLVTELPNLSVPPPAVSLPNTHIPPPSVVIPNMSVPPPLNTTIPLNLPKNKVKSTPPPPALIQPPGTSPVIIPDAAKPDNKPLSSSSSSVLSSLSEEELIRKAAEMLGEAEDPEKDESPEPGGKTAAASDSKYPGASQSVKCAPVMYTAPSAAVAAATATAAPPPKRTKIDPSQPPVPGLEDEFET